MTGLGSFQRELLRLFKVGSSNEPEPENDKILTDKKPESSRILVLDVMLTDAPMSSQYCVHLRL